MLLIHQFEGLADDHSDRHGNSYPENQNCVDAAHYEISEWNAAIISRFSGFARSFGKKSGFDPENMA
jgi:hypothetical protein